MAYEIPGFSYTLPSGADFSAGAQFRFVNADANGKAVNPAAAGAVVGVRQNRPKLNEGATIVHNGVSIVEAGAAITNGALVTTDNTGRAVTAATGNLVHGRAHETASAAGVRIAVLLTPGAGPAA